PPAVAGRVVDGERRAARIVEPDGRRRAGDALRGRRRRHRRVVGLRPDRRRQEGRVAALVVGGDVAGEYVHLHRVVGGDVAANLDAAVHEVALALVERDDRFEAAVRVLVDIDGGAAFTGHDREAGVLEHLEVGPVGDVDADGRAVVRAP